MYVKDEGANLNTLITVLMKIISCTPFMLLMSYSSHVMPKCCQYVNNNLKVCQNEKGFNQRCIIYSSKYYYVGKKFRIGRQEWTRALLMIVYNKLALSTIVVVENVIIVTPRLCVFKVWLHLKRIVPFNPLIWWVKFKK
jgi:hypothetical protein